jgi:2-phospho-L-lactate guanylyltransferase
MASDTRAQAAIVIPLRSFALAKARLADALDADERAALARSMAETVVAAAGTHRVVVVSSASEVVAWAREMALPCIDDPGSLNAAAQAGRAWAQAQHADRYAVVHADLPLATTLDAVVADGVAAIAVLVPDHRGDGNPVLALPAAVPFNFAYGPESAARHAAEARRHGLEVRIVDDQRLGFDVDVAADLAQLAAYRRAGVR